MAKTAPISDEAILKATRRGWQHWQAIFAQINAKELPHKDIAAILYDTYNVPSWWCQMLTVRFEQEIGRREIGQRNDGNYEFSISKTVSGDMDEALSAWEKRFAKTTEFNKVKITAPPKLTQSDKWRYWRVNLEDGSRIQINFSDKPDHKALFQLTHSKLENKKTVEAWKAYWKRII